MKDNFDILGALLVECIKNVSHLLLKMNKKQ